MATIYARLINQFKYKYKYQSVVSARFDKQHEAYQVLDEIDLYTNLKNNKNLTESDIENFDVKSQFKQQIQKQKTEDSGWRFDENLFNDKIVL